MESLVSSYFRCSKDDLVLKLREEQNHKGEKNENRYKVGATAEMKCQLITSNQLLHQDIFLSS